MNLKTLYMLLDFAHCKSVAHFSGYRVRYWQTKTIAYMHIFSKCLVMCFELSLLWHVHGMCAATASVSAGTHLHSICSLKLRENLYIYAILIADFAYRFCLQPDGLY